MRFADIWSVRGKLYRLIPVTLITIRLGRADAEILMAVHALIMKCLGPVSGPMAAGTIGFPRHHPKILMTSDTLLMEGILPAGHHVIAHPPLMARGTVLGRFRIALLIIMVAVIAVQAVFLGMGVVLEHALVAQCRLIFAIRLMALAA